MNEDEENYDYGEADFLDDTSDYKRKKNYDNRVDDFLDDTSDYEREAFYAVTGGMYGEYDEWKERDDDMGSLMDSLGY